MQNSAAASLCISKRIYTFYLNCSPATHFWINRLGFVQRCYISVSSIGYYCNCIAVLNTVNKTWRNHIRLNKQSGICTVTNNFYQAIILLTKRTNFCEHTCYWQYINAPLPMDNRHLIFQESRTSHTLSSSLFVHAYAHGKRRTAWVILRLFRRETVLEVVFITGSSVPWLISTCWVFVDREYKRKGSSSFCFACLYHSSKYC